jgi:DNA-binding NarL/FixJ family response regulator
MTIMDSLTQREQDVVRLLAQGMRHGDIARALHIEYDTVCKHAAAARRKTGADTTMQLAIKVAHELNRKD